jgi:ribosomal protein L37AE/L43A
MGCCDKKSVLKRLENNENKKKLHNLADQRRISLMNKISKLKIDQIKTGIKEVTKVTLGIDICSKEEANRRLNICKVCDERENVKIGSSEFWSCKKCNCILQIKQFSNSHRCPLNKW